MSLELLPVADSTKIRRAIVIGQGSIGRRHARLLAEGGAAVAVVTRQSSADHAFSGTLEGAAALLQGEPNLVVIASPTASHAEHLEDVLRRPWGCPILLEKPLVRRLAELDGLLNLGAEVRSSVEQRVRIGFNWRFHPGLVELRRRLADVEIYTIRLFCGSYLPDWRPGRRYQETSSARRSSGGGVLRDLSHELDFALLLGGDWRRVYAAGGRLSDLEIDVEDCVELLIETERCPAAAIHLNYLSDPAQRYIEAVTSDGLFRLDFLSGKLLHRGAEAMNFGAPNVDAMLAALHRDSQTPASEEPPCAMRACSWREALRIQHLIEAAESRLGVETDARPSPVLV